MYRLQNAINMLLLRQLQQCYDKVVDIIQARQMMDEMEFENNAAFSYQDHHNQHP